MGFDQENSEYEKEGKLKIVFVWEAIVEGRVENGRPKNFFILIIVFLCCD